MITEFNDPCQSRLDLDIELIRNGATRNDVDFEDGYFPALKHNYDRRKHAHHMVTGQSAPHNSVPEYLTGRIQIQNNPMPQEFTQPQKTTTHFSPNNTLPIVEQTPQKQNSESGNPINKLVEAIESIAPQQQS